MRKSGQGLSLELLGIIDGELSTVESDGGSLGPANLKLLLCLTGSLCSRWKAKYVNKFVQILNFVFTVGQGVTLRARQLHQARTTDNWNVENIVFRPGLAVFRTGIMSELYESRKYGQVVGAMRG